MVTIIIVARQAARGPTVISHATATLAYDQINQNMVMATRETCPHPEDTTGIITGRSRDTPGWLLNPSTARRDTLNRCIRFSLTTVLTRRLHRAPAVACQANPMVILLIRPAATTAQSSACSLRPSVKQKHLMTTGLALAKARHMRRSRSRWGALRPKTGP